MSTTRVSEIRVMRRVQFYETDAAGIVHFSWFPRYMEEAEHALWRAAGLSIAPVGSQYGFPRVSVSCEYRRPLRFEDEFETWIRIVALSERSIRYRCELTMGDTSIASMGMTAVCISTGVDGTMRAAALPDEVRSRLEVAADVVA